MKKEMYTFKKRFERTAFIFITSMLLTGCDAYEDAELKKVAGECSDEDAVGIEKLYIIDDDAEEDIHKAELEKLKEFYKYINDNNIEFFSACEDYIFIYKSGLTDKFMYYDMDFKEEIEDQYYRGARCIYVSNNYLNDEEIKLSEGSFQGKDKTAIPVILGSSYKDIAEIGEKIPFAYTNKDGSFTVKYIEVTGFVEDKINIMTDVHIGNEVDLSYSIVVSEKYYEEITGYDSDEEKKSNICYYYTDALYNFKDKDTKSKAENYSRELGLNFKFERSFK